MAAAVDVATDIAEGIPFVGASLKLAFTYRTISGHLCVKKVERFLAELDKAPWDMREAFLNRLRQEHELQRFGETVVLLLEKMDDMEKPSIVGRLFRAVIEGKLEKHVAERLAALVGRTYAGDLQFLSEFTDVNRGSNDEIATALASKIADWVET